MRAWFACLMIQNYAWSDEAPVMDRSTRQPNPKTGISASLTSKRLEGKRPTATHDGTPTHCTVRALPHADELLAHKCSPRGWSGTTTGQIASLRHRAPPYRYRDAKSASATRAAERTI